MFVPISDTWLVSLRTRYAAVAAAAAANSNRRQSIQVQTGRFSTARQAQQHDHSKSWAIEIAIAIWVETATETDCQAVIDVLCGAQGDLPIQNSIEIGANSSSFSKLAPAKPERTKLSWSNAADRTAWTGSTLKWRLADLDWKLLFPIGKSSSSATFAGWPN